MFKTKPSTAVGWLYPENSFILVLLFDFLNATMSTKVLVVSAGFLPSFLHVRSIGTSELFIGVSTYGCLSLCGCLTRQPVQGFNCLVK